MTSSIQIIEPLKAADTIITINISNEEELKQMNNSISKFTYDTENVWPNSNISYSQTLEDFDRQYMQKSKLYDNVDYGKAIREIKCPFNSLHLRNSENFKKMYGEEAIAYWKSDKSNSNNIESENSVKPRANKIKKRKGEKGKNV